MNRKRFIPICKYQLYRERQMTVVLLIVLAINFTLGAVLKVLGTNGGSIDIVTMVFAPIIGYSLFSDTFKFSTYNGSARKTYLKATCVTAVILSAVWSFLTSVIMLFAERFTTAHRLFPQIYLGGFLAMFLWLFTVILCLLIFSWLLAILMFSLSKRAKRIFLLVSSILVPLIVLLNVLTEGVVIGTLLKIEWFFFGVVGNTISSYLSSAMLVLLSAFFCGVAWLFIKKVEI